jgi:hypothetical protein
MINIHPVIEKNNIQLNFSLCNTLITNLKISNPNKHDPSNAFANIDFSG